MVSHQSSHTPAHLYHTLTHHAHRNTSPSFVAYADTSIAHADTFFYPLAGPRRLPLPCLFVVVVLFIFSKSHILHTATCTHVFTVGQEREGVFIARTLEINQTSKQIVHTFVGRGRPLLQPRDSRYLLSSRRSATQPGPVVPPGNALGPYGLKKRNKICSKSGT